MALGYDGKLYILAFDHRGSFQKKMFGIEGDPTPEETERRSPTPSTSSSRAWSRRSSAARSAATRSACSSTSSSAATSRSRPRSDGLKLAMPVEKSGQDKFDFEYGDDFGEHIEQFDPDFSKVLVRYNPDGDAEAEPRRSSSASSAWPTGCTRTTASSSSSCWCPAEPTSSSSRSAATPTATTPSCAPSSCAAPSRRSRTSASRSTSGRSRASTRARTPRCWRRQTRVGRGPRERRLRAARPRRQRREGRPLAARRPRRSTGFVGFAIGRSIWWDALKGFLDGSLRARGTRREQIAENYLRFIRVYEEQETAVA